jgi:hypothetical protein
MCGGQTPMGLSIRTGLGGPDPPFPPGKGSGAAMCHQGGDCRTGPATCPWQKALRGTPAQLSHYICVGGLRAPKTGHGLPTDTLGRYADTTVSLPVSKAAHRIIAHCARAGGVQSTHSAARVSKG